MILAAEEDESALHAVRNERGVHLIALIDRAAIVLKRVKEERRRFDLIGVLHGAVPPEFFNIRPDGRAALTQLTDVEDEVNGLFTYDRKVMKVLPERLKAANKAVIESMPLDME